jgi:hypothetical protein
MWHNQVPMTEQAAALPDFRVLLAIDVFRKHLPVIPAYTYLSGRRPKYRFQRHSRHELSQNLCNSQLKSVIPIFTDEPRFQSDKVTGKFISTQIE